MIEWREFANPKFFVALIAVLIFAWAYGENVGDETMKGAIIGGFNLALGFYLGSTSGASRASENTAKAFDAITATAQANGTDTATRAADAVAGAAADKADEIGGKV